MSAWSAAREAAGHLADAGIDDAAFEAEYLARKAGNLSRPQFFAGAPIDAAGSARFADAIRRRLGHEPAAYIAGEREFCGHRFAVGSGVLVPRPETELLVEAALAELEGTWPARVVDVGTGSGCIAISIAMASPNAHILAVEQSKVALQIARRNAEQLQAKVSFVRGDLTSPVAHADVVVANLPYIPSGEIAGLQPEVRDWEPRSALDGGPDGLCHIRALLADCGGRVRPRLLALEVGAGQAPAVARMAGELGAAVTVTRDLAGIERVVSARWA